jgi:hypothetical protein
MDYFVRVLPRGDESLEHEDLEVLEHVRPESAHDSHKLLRELEGGALEAEVLGGGREDEPKVNVDEVALVVEQNVTVVPGKRSIFSSQI